LDNVSTRNLLLTVLLILSFGLRSQQSAFPIKVGVYNNYPKVYLNENGQVAGIFPEIFQLIASAENWQVEYVPGNWNECLQRLQNQEIDIMVDVALSDDRQKIFDFNNESVLISWGTIYTKSRPNINSVLDLSDKNIAVMKNSILTTGQDGIYNLVQRYEVKCKFIEVDDYEQVFELVRQEKADAGIVNRHFGAAFGKQYGLIKSNFIFLPSQLRFAFPKNSSHSAFLIEKIDKHLTRLENDMNSDYYTILTKYNLYPKKASPLWLMPLLILLCLLTIFFIISSLIMKWRIKQKTLELQTANDDLKREITKHRETLAELEKSREIYRNFVENIPGLVFMYDQSSDGNRLPIITTNRHEEFLGKIIADSIKSDYNNFFNFIIPEDWNKLQKVALTIENTKQNLDFEYRVKLSEDRVKWFRVLGKVKMLEDGKTRWQGVILDVDDRKKIERELELYREQLEKLVECRTIDLEQKTSELEKANQELLEADRLKSIFLASMSHELRTPLNSIIGFTGILLMGMVGDLTDEQRYQLDIVKKSASHLLDLINDILDISKIEANKAELACQQFFINDLIHEVIQLLQPKAAEKGINLFYEAAERIDIYSDQRRLKQILINLASNAVKFTEKGNVTFTSEKLKSGEMIITVTDTGKGVKPEDMKKLFEPFQQIDASLTKKQEGTGLGLHLTQKIVTLLNGKITVQSEFGKGTTFRVTLPDLREE